MDEQMSGMFWEGNPSHPLLKRGDGGDCISDIARYEERTEGSEKNQRGIL